MDDINGFWICSCCKQVFHTDISQPVNQYGDELFECVLCDITNQEHELSEAL